MISLTASMKYMKMSVYKILDSQGRIVIPAELREQMDIQKGDILELNAGKNCITVEKLDVVKLNDESFINMKNMILSTAKKLDQGSLLFLARKFVEMAEKEELND